MHSLPNLWEYFPSAEVPIPMIRFLLPALLLLVASCQAPQNSQSDCCASSPASPASLTSPAKDCPSCSAKAASASQASMEETCVMAGTGACEEGGDCPMQAACDAGVSACGDSCEMKAKNNAAATKALLFEASADCESCTAEKMCSDCDAAVKAMWAACEGCTEGAFCDDCLQAIQASMESACDSCEMESASECESCESAEATTTAAMHEGCVMAGTGACEEGGDCPMQAACDAGVSACGDSCEMKAKNNAAATKALLMEATAACESCTAEKMCSDCDSSVKAMWAACEGCTEGAFCDDCLKSIKASMAGHCDGGSCESTQATGATKASAETTTTKSSCCDTPQG